MKNFQTLLDNLDLELFRQIHSQTSDNDKRSLLACQKAVGGLLPEYVYLEIGSYVGGSLQPYVLDGKCKKIISIDKRPKISPDERGVDVVYLNNTTALMLENLRRISPSGIEKIQTFDGDASEIESASISEQPQLCFIDGEHTDEATFRDFQFCIKVAAPNSAILFHDAAIIYNALSRIIDYLEEKNLKFRAYNLPDHVFVVELGDFPLCKSPSISEMLFNNYVGYLKSLDINDQYRRFANKKMFRFVRNLKAKFTGSNITK